MKGYEGIEGLNSRLLRAHDHLLEWSDNNDMKRIAPETIIAQVVVNWVPLITSSLVAIANEVAALGERNGS